MHLHVASAYSLRHGVAPPAALVERAAELGMETLAVTDRDGLYGAVRHVLACRDAGIGAVVGADLALAGGGRIVVLAAGRAGWRSLCRLVSAAHAAPKPSGGGPVVTGELLGAHAEGLVVLLGPASDVGRAVAERRPDEAARRLAAWRRTVGDVAIEIVNHHDKGDGHRAARMLALAREAGVPAVLGNAVRYLDPLDYPVAQVLDVTRRLVPLDRRHLEEHTGHAYLKSVPEMRRVAELSCGADRDAPAELLAATRRLAEHCVLDPDGDLGMNRVHLPAVDGDAHAQLVARCAEGLARRGMDRSKRAADRLADELAVIARKGLAAYFLTVADAAALIRSRGIRCAIRGSGAGSLVNHLLGIGDLDPLRHDLLMERFLADSREGLPDIDLDVESARRHEAYRALFDRYGADGTACVSMMETYRARSAIRDVGNAVGLPPQEIDAIAKAFPHIRARQIRAALHDLPELRQSNLAQSRLEVLFRIAERLDGLPRHIAMHPCGVLLSNPTLHDRTPVENSALGFPMSQFDKDDVEAMGLLKLDVIGVRMQSAMAHAVAQVARTTGERLDLEAVPPDDPATFALIRTSRTLGCFQIESPGQRELIGRLQPRDIDDLVIDISLFRPGPVNSDMVSPFLDARDGLRAPGYPHPDLEPALRESQGVVVFHEQVLRVVDVMTGCGLSTAEAARRALGDAEGQAVIGAWFRERALARGYDEAAVERVWRTLTAFGAFGFCKAHAASFALPTYQSAWLKRHHTAAFYAGVLTHDPGMYPKRVILDDARHFGVPILPLDVNHSTADWHVEPVSEGGPTGIRVALSEVKGISEAEVGAIVAERPYRSLTDFWRRTRVSRPIAERLVLAGGFDALYSSHQPAPGPDRSQPVSDPPQRGPNPDRLESRQSVPGAELDRSGAGQSVLGADPDPSGSRQSVPGAELDRSGAGQPESGADSSQRGSHLLAAWPQAAPRRDLLCRVGALERVTARPGRGRGVADGQLPLGFEDGELDPVLADPSADPALGDVSPTGLPPMTPAEIVEAELEILGMDVSRHVLSFYGPLLGVLGAVRAADLPHRPPGTDVLVAGVKVATQTPAVRSGQRVIFATLDDATGPVDLAFFESVQDRCAATVFGSWLLAVRGRVRRAGGRAVSITGVACWDLAFLEDERRRGGPDAVRAAMSRPGPPGRSVGRRIVQPTGFAMSPYSDIGAAGAPAASRPPAKLWHASTGSSGPAP